MSPLETMFMILGATIFVVWLLSVWTKEYSWVDRLWSIVPVIYVALFAWDRGFEDDRLNLMAGLVFLWGARLTFNFARKGGYAPGGEDYRWAELRERMSSWQYQLFNFFFIAGYQNVLLALLALPAWIVWRQGASSVSMWDFGVTGLFLFFFVGEVVADEQQWRFHQDKKRRMKQGESMHPRFLTRGLFRYCRHPNFFCEQGIWWSLYLFSVAAGAPWLNLSILGPVLLTLLFQGSTRFTEEISSRKYPEYAEYQKTTSRLIPWRPSSKADPSSENPSAA